MTTGIEIQDRNMSLLQKAGQLNFGLMLLISLIAGVGFTALYSAGGGNLDPWASKQILRFLFSFAVMIFVAMVNIQWWYKLSYIAFLVGLLLLAYVEVMGHIGMGAQRWINLGFMNLQPSELMKIAAVMALAKYFHTLSLDD